MNADTLIKYVLLESKSNITWVNASNHEHREAADQVRWAKEGAINLPDHLSTQLTHLSNPDNFSKALSGSKSEFYNAKKFRKVFNTEAGVVGRRKMRSAIKGLEGEKVDRVRSIISNSIAGKGSVEKPIIIRHKASGHEHLLGGNTRATVATSMGHPVNVHVIEYN